MVARWLWELIDRPLGISTTILPAFFNFLSRTLLQKQKIKAQLTAGRGVR